MDPVPALAPLALHLPEDPSRRGKPRSKAPDFQLAAEPDPADAQPLAPESHRPNGPELAVGPAALDDVGRRCDLTA